MRPIEDFGLGRQRHDPGDEMAEAGRFTWPPIRDGSMHLTSAQFSMLVAGLDWTRVPERVVRKPLRVA